MDEMRALLEAERASTLELLAGLSDAFDRFVDASRDSNADDEHDPEGATIAFERSQVDALMQQARTQLVEIDGAMARVDDGTHGTCERCGRPIATARLEARPTARTCVTCPTR